MDINVPAKVRSWIYIIGIIGQPFMVYLVAKGLIGTLELTLWAALTVATFGLARLNVPSGPAKENLP